MTLWHLSPASQPAPTPRPELLLMQVRRDNLLAHNRRLVREIEELTRQIAIEMQRYPDLTSTSEIPFKVPQRCA